MPRTARLVGRVSLRRPHSWSPQNRRAHHSVNAATKENPNNPPACVGQRRDTRPTGPAKLHRPRPKKAAQETTAMPTLNRHQGDQIPNGQSRLNVEQLREIGIRVTAGAAAHDRAGFKHVVHNRGLRLARTRAGTLGDRTWEVPSALTTSIAPLAKPRMVKPYSRGETKKRPVASTAGSSISRSSWTNT